MRSAAAPPRRRPPWRARPLLADGHLTVLVSRGGEGKSLLSLALVGGVLLGSRVAADPDYASFHWSHEVSPLLDHAYLERERERTPPAEYAAEVLGQWSDAVGSLFSRELLDRQSAALDVPALRDLAGSAQPIIGLDWGVSFDRSAAAVIYRLPVHDLNDAAPDAPVFVALPYVWPAGKPLAEVVVDVASAPVPFAYLCTETNGVGAMPSQELVARVRGRDSTKRQWNLVHTTNQIKTAGYGALLGLLEQGRLVLPKHPDLLRQLAGLRFEQGERGFTRIEAEDPATHDDVADALMLAALPTAPVRRRHVQSWLQVIAHPSKAGAEAPVPPVDQPVVETGAGLRVYRRPPLQSVAGSALTLPRVSGSASVTRGLSGPGPRRVLPARTGQNNQRRRGRDRRELRRKRRGAWSGSSAEPQRRCGRPPKSERAPAGPRRGAGWPTPTPAATRPSSGATARTWTVSSTRPEDRGDDRGPPGRPVRHPGRALDAGRRGRQSRTQGLASGTDRA